MPTSFSTAVKFTLEFEGGLVNHPNDPGGLTKHGISQRQYPSLNIRALTLEEARVIYRVDYWDEIGGDSLPPAVAFVLFDFAVNAGVSRASKAVQRLVDVRVDGDIGPLTIAAINVRRTSWVTENILHARARHYIKLVRSSPAFMSFIFGWEVRLLACAVRAGALL